MSETLSMPKNILIPIDYSEPSQRALRQGLAIAQASGARVTVVFAWSAPYAPSPIASDALHAEEATLFSRVREDAVRTLANFIKQVQQGSTVGLEWVVVSGTPQEKILELAQERNSDLIVMGSHGRGGVARLLLGSVTNYVLQHARCPVLVVPAQRD